MENKFQRKILLIKRNLQLRYVSVVFLSVFVGSLIIGGDLVYTLRHLIEETNPDFHRLLFQNMQTIMVKLGVYLVIILTISLIISHRFAGPIYRFEQSADALASGDLTHRVALRRGDELRGLEERFNAMISSLQENVKRDRRLRDELAKKIADLARSGRPVDVSQLQQIKAELDSLTSAFKV